MSLGGRNTRSSGIDRKTIVGSTREIFGKTTVLISETLARLHHSMPADIKRLMAYAPAMNSEFIVSYFGTLSRETSIDVRTFIFSRAFHRHSGLSREVTGRDGIPSCLFLGEQEPVPSGFWRIPSRPVYISHGNAASRRSRDPYMIKYKSRPVAISTMVIPSCLLPYCREKL